VTALTISESERGDAARRLYERLGFVSWGVEPRVLRWQGKVYDEVHLQLDLQAWTRETEHQQGDVHGDNR
jgi:L-amino acid N-acyltransferase YncA